MGTIRNALRLVEERYGASAVASMTIDVSPGIDLPANAGDNRTTTEIDPPLGASPSALAKSATKRTRTMRPSSHSTRSMSPISSITFRRIDAAHEEGIGEPHYNAAPAERDDEARKQTNEPELDATLDDPPVSSVRHFVSANPELTNGGAERRFDRAVRERTGPHWRLRDQLRARAAAAADAERLIAAQLARGEDVGLAAKRAGQESRIIEVDDAPLLIAQYRPIVERLLADWGRATSVVAALVHECPGAAELFSSLRMAVAVAIATPARVLLIRQMGGDRVTIDQLSNAPKAIASRPPKWRQAIRKTTNARLDVAPFDAIATAAEDGGGDFWKELRAEYPVTLVDIGCGVDSGRAAAPSGWIANIDAGYLVVELHRTTRQWAEQSSKRLQSKGVRMRGCLVAA